jgi:hypothetical protein
MDVDNIREDMSHGLHPGMGGIGVDDEEKAKKKHPGRHPPSGAG